MIDMAAARKDQLMNDLKAVIADAEELLHLTGDQLGEGAADVRSRITARMNQAKSDLLHLQEATMAKARAAGNATDEFVHDNPWKSIGIAAGIGLVVGLLVTRR